MACLPPAVGAHPSGRIGEDPSGIPNNLFPIVSQVVLPFLAVRVGFTQASELLLPVTLVFAVAAVLAALVRLSNLWLNGRLADQRRVAVGSDLSCEAYRRTLYQPYGVHVQRNSAAVLPFLAVVSASTSTDQAADRRGFPLSLQVHKPGGWFVPLIPCSA